MKNRNKKGFTLVELVIVIAVIAILAGVLIGTFAGVISRANQSKAVQEWKATVDAEYVEFVADKHEVPTFVNVNVNNKTIEFKNEGTATDKALPTLTYELNSANPARAVVKTLASFVVLDETNKVYFLWNTDGTYAVVATNTALLSESKYTGYTPSGTETADELVEEVTFKTLTYGGVTYYGLPVNS